MPTLTVEHVYKTDLAEIEKFDSPNWLAAKPEDLATAHPHDLETMSLSDVAGLSVAADELEPLLEQHGRP